MTLNFLSLRLFYIFESMVGEVLLYCVVVWLLAKKIFCKFPDCGCIGSTSGITRCPLSHLDFK